VTDRAGDSYVTARFKHIVTDEGHMVVTGVAGSERIQRCEDEPIHIPGAVQGFGVLIAVKEDAEGKLGVKIASEVCVVALASPSEFA
jgi:light-regulated signal transduction histidine kinase (bacteriophytochrome)